MTDPILLGVVVATALAFDFTNGFHDTGNAMATSIATRALKPKQAVLLSAVLNLVGAFLSLTVAATIATGIVDADIITLNVVLCGLAGAIVWNLVTWLFGIPSSSSHALVGGVVGAVLAAAGSEGVLWSGLIAKVMIPALIAPVVAILVATVGTAFVIRLTRKVPDEDNDRLFRWGQIGSASLVSLAHGTNDAQKSMGIILLALIAAGAVPSDSGVPFWVILSCALAMALGTYIGGWRVIRTLGKGLVELSSRQGMAAETSSAAVIMLSSYFGYSLSTTHVATGSILGSGVGKKGASVRWGIAGRMFAAWVITVPSAALVGAVYFWIDDAFGQDSAGSYVVFGLLVLTSGLIYLSSRRKPVNHSNVNDEWDPHVDREAYIAEAVATKDPSIMRVKRKDLKKAKKRARKAAAKAAANEAGSDAPGAEAPHDGTGETGADTAHKTASDATGEAAGEATSKAASDAAGRDATDK